MNEPLDDRAQRIQDRLRADGDEEAAELIDELYGLSWPAVAPAEDPPVEHIPTWEAEYVKKFGKRPPMGGPRRRIIDPPRQPSS